MPKTVFRVGTIKIIFIMKKIKLVSILFMMGFFTTLISCGGGSSTTTETSPDDMEVSNDAGDISDFLDEESESTTKSKSSSSEDWGKVLDSYEKYIDQYIQLMKKAKAGDISALMEYAEMLEKANDFGDKLENANDEMSASQMARFLKLQTKLANAVAQL